MRMTKCQFVNDQPNRHERKEPFIQRNADGSTEGRDPRKLPRELLETIHEPMPLIKVIRARCLDCCAYQPSEIAKCTAVDCVNWPYRMGRNPFSNRTGNPAGAAALARARMARAAENPRLVQENHNSFAEDDEDIVEEVSN